MNRLNTVERAAIVGALVEGNSIRSTCRMTGRDKETVTRLLADLGAACEIFQGGALRDLTCRRIECDEIWSFCYAKQKNVPERLKGKYGVGDVFTWVALDPDTKLAVCWRVGQRSADDAERFMTDLASRLRDRIQLTTDGYSPYVLATRIAFGGNVDFAQLVKEYQHPSESERRYSPPVIVKSEKHIVFGEPADAYISTSHVERQNLTMRMKMRRMTRLTNAFSKKIEGLENAVALHFMHYNFCRVHQSLKMTPAMAAGIAGRPWSIEQVIALMNPKAQSEAA